MATVGTFPFGNRMAFGRRGNVASAKQRGFYHLSLRKLFDFLNVNSMQKGVAAIKPAYSCSQGVPEMGTGSRYHPWDGRRAGSKRGAQKAPFYCGMVLWWHLALLGWHLQDCRHRQVDSVDAQQQKLMVVTGEGRKGKTIKCKIRYFTSLH